MTGKTRNADAARKRIYLASPYSSGDEAVRVERYKKACVAAGALMRRGYLVFSPIAHNHVLAAPGLPVEFEYWRDWCLSFLRSWATDLYALNLPGWRESVGVQAEIEEAKRLNIPVRECKWGEVYKNA